MKSATQWVASYPAPCNRLSLFVLSVRCRVTRASGENPEVIKGGIYHNVPPTTVYLVEDFVEAFSKRVTVRGGIYVAFFFLAKLPAFSELRRSLTPLEFPNPSPHKLQAIL